MESQLVRSMSKNLSVQECLHVSRQNEEALCLAVSEHMMDISQKMAISANPQKVKKTVLLSLCKGFWTHRNYDASNPAERGQHPCCECRALR